ncbi:hypothetical protein FRB99_000851 [Tulasnella sp. 403]|nr:hypothetical protein FRB99_000851 [Tulasnella sp. 403]
MDNTQRGLDNPFDRLPLEIFDLILHMALEASNSGTRLGRRLCLVSRAWCRAVRSMPDLWKVIINDRYPPKKLEDALRLSGNLPLHIKSVEDGNWGGWRGRDVDLVLGHAHRWHSLELKEYACRDVPYTTPFLAAAAPNLRRLSIVGESYVSYTLGDVSNLRHLDLRRVSMDWGATRLSGLVSLALVSISDPPDISRVVEILEASPQIETVDFRRWDRWTREPVLPTSALPSLTFPQLSSLRLSEIPLGYVLAIVKHIRAP